MRKLDKRHKEVVVLAKSPARKAYETRARNELERSIKLLRIWEHKFSRSVRFREKYRLKVKKLKNSVAKFTNEECPLFDKVEVGNEQ